MDVKKYFEEKIEKETRLVSRRNLEARERIEWFEQEKKFVATSDSVPEKTDTLEKLKAANGKSVFFEEFGTWTETAALKFDGKRIISGCAIYPIVCDESSVFKGLRRITTIEGGEIVFDNPYEGRSSIYQTAMLLGRQAGLEEADAQIDREKYFIEYRERNLQELKDGYAKVPEYLEKGSKIIYPQRQEDWEKCVCYRLTDLYRGRELDNAIEIMEALDNGMSVEDAGKLVSDEHSGTSYGIMMSIVLTFSKKGVEFCKANHDGYKSAVESGDVEKAKQWEDKFAEIEAENNQYAKTEIGSDGKGGKN